MPTPEAASETSRDRQHFFLLNIGHFLDHLFTLIFATVAALVLHREWGLSYAALLAYATPGFFAFGLFSLPAGWLADRWSREGMMAVFFIGIGIASIATSFVQTPLQMGIGLFVIGIFAAIYHPVGLAIVVERWKNTGMRLAVNGIWGNLGVACAALMTGFLIDRVGWRSAFVVPGVVSIGFGLWYLALFWDVIRAPPQRKAAATSVALPADMKRLLLKISLIVFFTSALSSVIFQATTYALPKIFDERMATLARALSAGITALSTTSTSVIGALAFFVFAVASLTQLVVGALLDRVGPRKVFLTMTAIQVLFFALMPGLVNGLALAVAIGFMIGVFGQIPINDYMIGKMATGEFRARVYGIRYVVSFTALALALPMIGAIHANWGFDRLFIVLASVAAAIFAAALLLPNRLPSPPTG
jgi:MFS family permease